MYLVKLVLVWRCLGEVVWTVGMMLAEGVRGCRLVCASPTARRSETTPFCVVSLLFQTALASPKSGIPREGHLKRRSFFPPRAPPKLLGCRHFRLWFLGGSEKRSFRLEVSNGWLADCLVLSAVSFPSLPPRGRWHAKRDGRSLAAQTIKARKTTVFLEILK